MKILLAYPRFPQNTFWSFDRALAASGRSSTMPPLGLLTLAALLPPEQFDLELADENVSEITDEALRSADVVFASAMVVQLDSLEALISRCRSFAVPIVVGGPLISGCYSELLERGLSPDTWFIGECERLVPELVEDLQKGSLRHVYAHVVDDAEEQRVRAQFGPAARILVEDRPSLDLAPTPRFDLLDLREYHSMAVQASRGCPIGCEFCDIWKQFGLKSRTGSNERLTDQLSYLFTLGWRGRVFIVDDNFIGNVGAARNLLPELERWNHEPKRFLIPDAHANAMEPKRLQRLRRKFQNARTERDPFAFSTEADVRIGDDSPKMTEIREAMARAGFNGVFLGIETPSAEALREARKKVNISKVGDVAKGLLDRVRRVQSAGMEVMSGFIIGFDDDPEDIDDAMIAFIEEAGIPMAMVGTLGVIPGTALKERLEREGRYKGALEGQQTHGFRLNFVPKGRSEKVVLDQYARVLEALYGGGLDSYYRRCERLMDTMPGPPRTGDRFGVRELRALLASFFVVRPRLAYARFLLRTLFLRPRFLAHAVVLALQGDHFHRLTVERVAAYRSASTGNVMNRPERLRRPDTVSASHA